MRNACVKFQSISSMGKGGRASQSPGRWNGLGKSGLPTAMLGRWRMSRTWAETFASTWRRKTTQHVATAPSKAVSCGGRTRAARATARSSLSRRSKCTWRSATTALAALVHQRYVRGREKE